MPDREDVQTARMSRLETRAAGTAHGIPAHAYPTRVFGLGVPGRGVGTHSHEFRFPRDK